MPASTPVATGSIAVATPRSDPKAAHSSSIINAVAAIASRSTSALMVARLLTPKLPEPEMARRRPCCLKGSKLRLINAIARSWPSRSPPSARTVASITARSAWRDTHTPPSRRGALLPPIVSSRRIDSPVGSRHRVCLTRAPAGVPSSARLSAMPSRKPSLLKRCAFTAGLSR